MQKYTKEDLVSQYKQAGIKEGDTIFLRISYKAIGPVDGGPKTVIDALLDSVGDTGTLVATAFPRRIYSFEKCFKRKYVVSNSHRLESNVGIIPKMMATFPKSCYSYHMTYPFIVLGCHAKEIASFHTNEKSPYSIISYIAERFDAKCLRIGGRVFTGTTHIAFSEALNNTNSFQKDLIQGLWVKKEDGSLDWQGDNVAIFCPTAYESFYYSRLKDHVELYRGPLGNGEQVITSMKATLSLERELLRSNPQLLLCTDPDCIICRTSYSYSDTSVKKYLSQQIKKLFHKKTRQDSFRRIKIVLARLFWGKPRV